MTVTLKEVMAQMPKERQQKIRKRDSILNLKDQRKSNQEESLIRE